MSTESAAAYARTESQTLWLFLSLYLMLLGFFIVLSASATFDAGKAKAASESLNAALSSVRPVSLALGDDDDDPQGARLLARLAGAARLDPSVSAAPSGNGLDLAIFVPVEAMFHAGSPSIKPGRNALLDRLAGILRNAGQSEWRYRLSAIVPAAYAPDGRLPATPTLASARAAELLRAMVRRGAPPASLSAGIARADGDRVGLYVAASPGRAP
ncbi:hypothetical protein FACS1894186_1040 [Alphaproteobacteria bacterium]|nr:hypothetical protein FACS1894186_1040 [Alphaproteobacteria bacterium]